MEGNEKHVEELLRCTRMETRKLVNSLTIAEDFKDDDWQKTEAQLPRHHARSLHVAGPSGPQCSSLSARHEDAGTDGERLAGGFSAAHGNMQRAQT